MNFSIVNHNEWLAINVEDMLSGKLIHFGANQSIKRTFSKFALHSSIGTKRWKNFDPINIFRLLCSSHTPSQMMVVIERVNIIKSVNQMKRHTRAQTMIPREKNVVKKRSHESLV